MVLSSLRCGKISPDSSDVNHNFTSNEFNSSLKKVIQYEFDSKDIPSFPIEMSDKQIKCFVKILYDNRKRMFLTRLNRILLVVNQIISILIFAEFWLSSLTLLNLIFKPY